MNLPDLVSNLIGWYIWKTNMKRINTEYREEWELGAHGIKNIKSGSSVNWRPIDWEEFISIHVHNFKTRKSICLMHRECFLHKEQYDILINMLKKYTD